MNKSMEEQMSLLLINSIFDTAALWFIYLTIHLLKSVPLPSQLQDKVFVFFSIILIVIALFIVVIQEPQMAAYVTQGDEKSTRIAATLSYLTAAGIVIVATMHTFAITLVFSFILAGASVLFLVDIFTKRKRSLQTLKITSRIFLMSKYGGVLLAELLIVVFKSYIMPTAGLLNIFLSDGIYMVFVIINVNMIFDLREKSQWYSYKYEIEETKEKEFHNEVDAKTYYKLSDDYHWAFNVMSLIIVFVTVIMFFIII